MLELLELKHENHLYYVIDDSCKASKFDAC